MGVQTASNLYVVVVSFPICVEFVLCPSRLTPSKVIDEPRR